MTTTKPALPEPDDDAVAPPPRVTDAPDRIWLQYGDIDRDCTHAECYRDGDVTWCDHAIFDSDVEYVRADRLQAAVAEARAETEALKSDIADALTTIAVYEAEARAAPGEGWTDADADAARLALELECLLTDKDVPMPALSRWWDSAHEALRLHRERLAATPSPAEQPKPVDEAACRARCDYCGDDWPCAKQRADEQPKPEVRDLLLEARDTLCSMTTVGTYVDDLIRRIDAALSGEQP